VVVVVVAAVMTSQDSGLETTADCNTLEAAFELL
jgi:hypothetical protein